MTGFYDILTFYQLDFGEMLKFCFKCKLNLRLKANNKFKKDTIKPLTFTPQTD